MAVAHIPREEFLNERWDYAPGEHVTFIEPTQQGKTTFAYQLLDQTMRRYPELSTVTLVPKPQDPAASKWTQELGMREVPDWPPSWRPFQEKPPGYALWPRHLKDVDEETNNAHLAAIFRKCLREQYWRGKSVTLVDDCYLAAVILRLNMSLEQLWTAGGGMGAGLWTTDQKPTGTIGGGSVSSFRLNSAAHLILGNDPVQANVKKFSEIGNGVDPYLVFEEVRKLRIHRINGKNVSEKLYINKAGPYMCVVGI